MKSAARPCRCITGRTSFLHRPRRRRHQPLRRVRHRHRFLRNRLLLRRRRRLRFPCRTPRRVLSLRKIPDQTADRAPARHCRRDRSRRGDVIGAVEGALRFPVNRRRSVRKEAAAVRGHRATLPPLPLEPIFRSENGHRSRLVRKAPRAPRANGKMSIFASWRPWEFSL